jgi:choline-phosphate cytidylyltransferase
MTICHTVQTKEMISTSQLKKLGNSWSPRELKESVLLVSLRSKYTKSFSEPANIIRIVRDYEKYIARQFKRGTSRQELNVSWLKKNELDLKRHVSEMRDAIRSNWTTTGQELGKELRQFWQASRPGSPARLTSYDDSPKSSSLTSPSALSHLSRRLEIPRADSPGPGSDFATGYSLVCIQPVLFYTLLEHSHSF